MADNSLVEYLSQLAERYPVMRKWSEHTDRAIIAMTRVGDLQAITAMDFICACITDRLWQDIANTAARYGWIDIVTWVHSNASINWQEVAFIARDAGYEDIASYADGYETVLSTAYSSEVNDFPLNIGPVGEPMEDKGEWIFDWRMQDYQEEFMPEEPNVDDINEDPWEEDAYTPFRSQPGWGFRGERLDTELSSSTREFEDDEDDDIISDTYNNDIVPAK